MTMQRKIKDVDNRALAIFIKNPIIGRAKTRIAKDSSDEKALDIYKKLLNITQEITTKVECHRYVFYDQFIDEEDNWDLNNFDKKLQAGKDLGDKMFAAFQLLNKEQKNKCLLIGSDCPYISPSLLETAFNHLDDHDFVIGPTFDGGYYLIGMKEASSVAFSNIRWSQETVLEHTIERIQSIGGTFKLLKKLNDIDHLEDWLEYKSKFN